MLRSVAGVLYLMLGLLAGRIALESLGADHDEFAIGFMSRIAVLFVAVSLLCAVLLFLRLRRSDDRATEDLDRQVGGAMLIALVTGAAAFICSFAAAAALAKLWEGELGADRSNGLFTIVTAVTTAVGAAAPYLWVGYRSLRGQW